MNARVTHVMAFGFVTVAVPDLGTATPRPADGSIVDIAGDARVRAAPTHHPKRVVSRSIARIVYR
jgi:hypothetical protein